MPAELAGLGSDSTERMMGLESLSWEEALLPSKHSLLTMEELDRGRTSF